MLTDRANPDDRELCVTRLEVLAENTLHYDGIPLEAVDGINKAVHLLKSSLNLERRHDPYHTYNNIFSKVRYVVQGKLKYLL